MATTVQPDLEQRRLQWRCRRGLLELDLILQEFLRRGFGQLSISERGDFIELLELPDNVLLDFLHAKADPEQEKFRKIIGKIV